jgi:dTDP-L-rhamnose 4-epimerase
MDKVLITGGAGFIGSRLAPQLLADGFSLRILDPLSPQVHGQLPHSLDWLTDERIAFMRGSLTERRDIEAALEGVAYVVHLAAETGTGQSMYEVARYNQVNSQGTALLLDVLANTRGHGVKRIVLSSSRSVYGEGAYVCDSCDRGQERVFPSARSAERLARHQWEPLCESCGKGLTAVATRETDPVRPASIYAATKYAQEDLVRVGCESLGIGYAILRLQNVYGEGQSLKNPYTGILSIFSTKIRRGLELTLFEDGLESRDFVHVDDVARAMRQCLVCPRAPNQVINVGSGTGTSVADVARKLSEAFGAKPNLRVTAEYRVGDIRHNFADIARLKRELDYEPRVSIEEGLKRFAMWVLTQPLPDDLLERANAELRARKLMG